jgi:fused signal recognition particle receptor
MDRELNLNTWNDAVKRFEIMPLWPKGKTPNFDDRDPLQIEPSIIFIPAQNTDKVIGTIIVACGGGFSTRTGCEGFSVAKKFADEGHKVMIAAADTFRAAAIEQLEVWAKRSGAEFVHHAEGSDPAAVAYDACQAAKARGCDIVFIDTAGRLQNKDYLMEELAKIVRVLKKIDPSYPHDMMLVLDGNTGQNAINQAKIFNQSFPLTGLVVTKLDGTAHGGSVLSIASSLKVPILWVGMGERIDQLVPFSKAEYVDGLFKE